MVVEATDAGDKAKERLDVINQGGILTKEEEFIA